MKLFVIYDIEEDKQRTKVAEACKDYGLRRVQYSTFFGDLNRNRQEELMQRIRRIVGNGDAYVLLLPTCERDLAAVMEVGRPQPASERTRSAEPAVLSDGMEQSP